MAAIGAIPGLIALAGSLIGFGKLTQRLKHVEQEVDEMKGVVAKVSVIEERTRNTDDNVKAIRGSMGSLTETLLQKAFDEIRSFRPKDTA